MKKMHLHTKATDDSKLYLTIDSLVNTLRQKNYSDDNIKKYLVKWVKEIINEQQAYTIYFYIFNHKKNKLN